MHNFYKNIEYFPEDLQAPLVSLLGFNPRSASGIEKTASEGYAQEIAQYLSTLSPTPGLIYAVVNALGAGEYFGPNKNADYFPEQDLIKTHHTFVNNGHVYPLHQNKNPEKKLGDILFSHYNPEMRRVELIITLQCNNPEVQRVQKGLANGDVIAVSMGTRVKFDTCSICKNNAKTREEYCDHMKYQANQVLPDGRRVYAINPDPRFFDISIVRVPADRTASIMVPIFMEKTASVVEPSEHDKLAELRKKIEVDHIAFSEDPHKLIRHSTPAIPESDLKLLTTVEPNVALSTMLGLRILPTPDEFQKIVTKDLSDRVGVEKLSSYIEEQNPYGKLPYMQLSDVGPDQVDPRLAMQLAELQANNGMLQPLIMERVIQNQGRVYPRISKPEERSTVSKFLFTQEEQPLVSPTQNPMPVMTVLGALYAGYIKLFGDTSGTGFNAFIAKHPILGGPVLGAALGAASYMAQETAFNKTASLIGGTILSTLIAAPASYYMSGNYEHRARQGEQINSIQNFVRRHPFLTAMTAGLAGGAARNS